MVTVEEKIKAFREAGITTYANILMNEIETKAEMERLSNIKFKIITYNQIKKLLCSKSYSEKKLVSQKDSTPWWKFICCIADDSEECADRARMHIGNHSNHCKIKEVSLFPKLEFMRLQHWNNPIPYYMSSPSFCCKYGKEADTCPGTSFLNILEIH